MQLDGLDRLDAVLDHVAVAADLVADLWPRYAGDLAGEWVGGGETAGFYSAQVRFANGMKLEGLEPRRVDENDFLRRFLDRSGPGAHHLTFKVPDIERAIEAAGTAGFPPVSISLDDPRWKEAFLHPKSSSGIVVQLAESHGDWEPEPLPTDLPAPRTPTPARLDRVTHAVDDLATARRLFEGLLGGGVEADGGDDVSQWLELAWPGGGVLRVISPTADGPLAAWIGRRPGRLHHLAFTTDDPRAVAGAVAGPDGSAEVPPEANLGVRLLLSPA